MKFKKYLTENRTKILSYDVVINLILKNCKKHFKSIYMTGKTIPIYRGTNDIITYGYINTNKGEARKSAYQKNYMTLLMDNLPSWSKYPKRSRSIICSTDTMYSENYGSLNHVIPYDNTLVGIAPKDDIFYSFKVISDWHNGVVRDFNWWIHNTLELWNVDTQDDSWITFKNSMYEIQKNIDNNDNNDDNSDKLRRYGIFKKNNDPFKIMNKIFSPRKNGFRLGINNLNSNREVWIQGESIIIGESEMDFIIKEVIDNL